MKLTKFTHSCVRLDDGDRTLVIDPGIWSEPGALLGADAVLITHEHVDHIDVLRLAGLGVPVFAPEGADIGPSGIARKIDLTRISAGEEFTAAGFNVAAVGGRHASIYGDKPGCPNVGYVVDGSVYHPGDSLHVPSNDVNTLLVPLHASWLKTDAAIDFVKAINPRHTVPIHDGQLNERGLNSTGGWLAEETDNGFHYLAPRETLNIP
jgi:L-ascorbate metabolism protein UlaG (beta-lactamase superfamily)